MSVDELEDLTAAIYNAAASERLDELQRAIDATEDDGSAGAAAVIGGAYLVAYKLGYQQSDLDQAEQLLGRATSIEPTPSRQVNLAVALLEQAVRPRRGDREGSRGDYRRAVELLEAALAQTPRDDSRWVDRATILLGARLSMINVALFGSDLAGALDFGEELVREASRQGRGNGEPENLLAGGLVLHASQGGGRPALDRAVALYRASVEMVPPGHLDRPLRQSNLSGALLDRYELTGDLADRNAALSEARVAFTAIDIADPRSAAVANNLVNALLVVAREDGDLHLLDQALAVIPQLRRAYHAGDPLYATIIDNLASAAGEVYALVGRRDDLDAAAHLRQEAVRATDEGDPHLAWRVVMMAIDCGRQALADLDFDVAEQRLALGLSALEHIQGEDDAARLAAGLGTLAYDVFLKSGRIDFLELAARLHLSGIDALDDRSPAVANLANNAGLALLDRFERLGSSDDLAAAISAHEIAAKNTTTTHRDYAARRMNLATAYHRGYGRSGNIEQLDAAEREARAAVAAAGLPEVRTAALGTLVDVLRRRFVENGDEAARVELNSYLSGSSTVPVRATDSFRRFLVARDIGRKIDNIATLRDAVSAGLRDRRSVALAAAGELALAGLALQMSGSAAGAGVVTEAVAAVRDALSRMTADGLARHRLSWSRDAYGLAGIAAQSKLLAGDAPGAAEAFELGHATALSATMSGKASDLPVRIWASPHGGGAVIGAASDAVGIPLPLLTRPTVEHWARRLAIASRLGAPALTPVLEAVLRQAGQCLAPLLEALPAGEPLVWCAGGLLASLPISAVPVRGVPLLERHRLRHAPTVAVAGWAEERGGAAVDLSRSWSLAAPAPSRFRPLLGAAREAQAFAPEGQRLIGEDATVAAAHAALAQADALHFACHARTSGNDPLSNHLLLAGDEPLFADDICNLEASARLVVLAACDTADVGAGHADEALGLATAFQMAGVPGIIASLWPVYDEPTATLMVALARELAVGQPPADALRSVTLRARSSGVPASTAAAFACFGA